MNKTAKVIISILILYIISLLSFSGCNGKTKVIEIEKTDTIQICDTAYITDTLIFEKVRQVPKEVYITRIDTIKENTILLTENKIYQDTIKCQEDSIIQEISITGINPTLDYSKVILKKQDKVITNTITVTKFVKNNKRISLGLQLGYGYAFKSKELTPYVGIGFNVKI